ncbi:MAG: flagellin N-terminal helical domain-containing protein [Peptoanaerobacter stomatis]|uniref:flagellin N-terminal helical domain-containing protein n=1 Tax=Peptoanaerobacter stomatis TaxID=796937 RepID=UPI003FA1645A
MIINHNMMAMNAHRSLGVNSGGMGKSVEKLSTGQRINRAADDAAGLYISEKMRSQIRGLTQASRNAQDGISAVQTAEGALDEVHSMLQRMRELVVQGANDPNQDEDRGAIQSEIKQLTKEIQDVSKKTQFNKQTLLNGEFKDKKLQVGANQDQALNISIKSMSAGGIGIADIAAADQTASKTEGKSAEDWTELNAAYEFDVTINGVTKHITMNGTTEKSKDDAVTKINAAFRGIATAAVDGNKIKITASEVGSGSVSMKATGTSAADKGLKTAVGTEAATSTDGKDELKKGDVSKALVDVSTYEKANDSLGIIDNAIKTVSGQRSDLGAIQNRLEHTIKNLDNAAENTQAAESRIRDTDMAKEMSKFTKDNILTQAAQAMLAQANQLPQQVLQLLR